MSHLWTRQICLMLGVALLVRDTFAQQEIDAKRLVQTIVAAWMSRQKDISALRAQATVDVFYSKGYATSRFLLVEPKSTYGPIPVEDMWFRGGHQSWAIDFKAGSFRKEFYKARIHMVDESIAKVPPRILYLYELFLFNGTKYTLVIHPEERDWPGKPPGYRQHVAFNHGIGHAFVIWPEDLPLLWCAGGTITGDWPNPMKLLKVDGAEQFALYGATDWHGRRCVILRVRNQQSTDSVVEFWADRDPPHAIYRSQIIHFVAEGERIERQIDVQYKEVVGQLVPSKWQLTYYDYSGHQGELFISMETITIQDVEINRPLSEELFTVRLEPGMGVYDADNNQSFVVDLDGKLVPYQDPEQQRRIAARARQQRTVRIAAPVIGVVALTVAAWFGYRYLRHARRKNT